MQIFTAITRRHQKSNTTTNNYDNDHQNSFAVKIVCAKTFYPTLLVKKLHSSMTTLRLSVYTPLVNSDKCASSVVRWLLPFSVCDMTFPIISAWLLENQIHTQLGTCIRRHQFQFLWENKANKGERHAWGLNNSSLNTYRREMKTQYGDPIWTLLPFGTTESTDIRVSTSPNFDEDLTWISIN